MCWGFADVLNIQTTVAMTSIYTAEQSRANASGRGMCSHIKLCCVVRHS